MQPYVFREKKKGRVEWLEQIPLHKSQAVVRHFPFWLLCTFAESTENWSGASNRSSNSLTLIELLAETLWRTSQPPLHRVGKFCTVCLIFRCDFVKLQNESDATSLEHHQPDTPFILFFRRFTSWNAVPCPACWNDSWNTTYSNATEGMSRKQPSNNTRGHYLQHALFNPKRALRLVATPQICPRVIFFFFFQIYDWNVCMRNEEPKCLHVQTP